MLQILSFIVAIITLVVTISIPIQIMKVQKYTNLMTTYESFEFSHAFQSVINFFYDDCDCDTSKVSEKYYERFKKDFEDLKNKDFKKDKQDILHYQRRLLNDYFLELEMCRSSSWFLKSKIRKDWTVSEAYVCKILVFMNKAVDDNPQIFKDISSIRHDRMPKVSGLNKYLVRFYNVLKQESPDMQV